MRTAESVVLTLWPPGPDARLTSMRRSRVLVDLDLHLVRLRQHRHRRGRGVDAAARLGLGHPLDPVHAALVLEPAPGAVAPDLEDDLAQATDAGLAGGQQLDRPSGAARRSGRTSGTAAPRTARPPRRRRRPGSPRSRHGRRWGRVGSKRDPDALHDGALLGLELAHDLRGPSRGAPDRAPTRAPGAWSRAGPGSPAGADSPRRWAPGVPAPGRAPGCGPGRTPPPDRPIPVSICVRRRSMSSRRSSRLTTRSRWTPRLLRPAGPVVDRRVPGRVRRCHWSPRPGAPPRPWPAPWRPASARARDQAALRGGLAVRGECLVHGRDGDLDHGVVGLLGGDALEPDAGQEQPADGPVLAPLGAPAEHLVRDRRDDRDEQDAAEDARRSGPAPRGG